MKGRQRSPSAVPDCLSTSLSNFRNQCFSNVSAARMSPTASYWLPAFTKHPKISSPTRETRREGTQPPKSLDHIWPNRSPCPALHGPAGAPAGLKRGQSRASSATLCGLLDLNVFGKLADSTHNELQLGFTSTLPTEPDFNESRKKNMTDTDARKNTDANKRHTHAQRHNDANTREQTNTDTYIWICMQRHTTVPQHDRTQTEQDQTHTNRRTDTQTLKTLTDRHPHTHELPQTSLDITTRCKCTSPIIQFLCVNLIHTNLHTCLWPCF